MTAHSAQQGRGRRGLLNLVLLGVLLTAIAAAYVLARSRFGPRRARGKEEESAARIVEQMRRSGLAHYWKPVNIRWFLIRRQARPVGWRVTVRTMRPERAFRGLAVRQITIRGQTIAHWERWQLNANATKGSYAAGTVRARMVGLSVQTDTHIDMSDGRLAVRQKLTGEWRRSSAAVPGNYLPEGTIPLARFLVASQVGRADFTLVLNSLPPAGRRTRFGKVLIERFRPPAGRARGTVAAVRVRFKAPRQTAEEIVYWLDSSGHVLRCVFPKDGHEEIAVSQQSVLRIFPDAAAYVQGVSKAGGSPLPIVGSDI